MHSFGFISLQPDWPIDVANARNAVDGPHEFWASAYRPGHDSVHRTVRASARAAADAQLVSLDVDGGGLHAEYVSARQLRLACAALDIPPALFSAPRQTVACTHIARGSGVRAFDVSPLGGLLVAGGDDGALDVYDTEAGTHRVQLAGHLGDVTCCRFFPSGQVVLSGASDMRVKIWSAADGSNPVTLVGHTAAVTDLAIIDVGKTVLSAAKDGSVRLWSCGAAECLRTYELSQMPVNAICLATSTLAVACEDGRVLLLDLDSHQVSAEFGSIGDLPVRAVAYDAQTALLVAGRADGSVCVWLDGDQKTEFRRGQAPVSAVQLVSRQTGGTPLICVGTEDGQLYLVSLDPDPEVSEDLVAFDVDPICQIRVTPAVGQGAGRQQVWAAGQDSRVCRF
ncbi:hypothetical protein LPJ63_000229 [Coemansia sp. RSA 2711]|nr:hypothetical protein LPJ63_000229 [Coemansia sp. RSA 2711]KAJ2318051.1 hypothetical protein IWW52_002784 [Coemansia sp. RSA 2704]KAJ2387701.1 hypothetical protein H4S02_003234 [Coemansia sp. RSA 2611]KAJ2733220.1 hypothetical protein H4R23_002661 [Coemansia sp. Cherry 401B]